jgi:hypothetical protein
MPACARGARGALFGLASAAAARGDELATSSTLQPWSALKHQLRADTRENTDDCRPLPFPGRLRHGHELRRLSVSLEAYSLEGRGRLAFS